MKKSILVGALLVSTLSFGQKKNETSAAVEYLRFEPAMQKQDFATAKIALVNAKEFIDLAAEHPDTKESPKTLYYKGLIYLSATQLADEMGDPAFLKDNFGETNAIYTTSVESFTKSFNSGKKYQSDVEDAAYKAQIKLDKKANAAYTAEEYTKAAELYDWRAKYMKSIGVLDSGAVFYSGVCAEKSGDFDLASKNYLMLAEAGYQGPVSYNLASGAFRKAGNIEKAKAVISEGRAKFPNDRDLLLELVNINIDANDPAGAEAALSAAIAADPNNKQLFYTIGTIYIEMKENAKAEKSLLKALEIDPNYVDAQYQLGAHLVSWAGDLKTTASNLKLGDAQYDVLMSQSTETYQRAVAPLEKYISTNPTDGPVLNILYQLHKALGNTEKAAEFKKRYQEAK
jgi:tetratricopeptide (TPR) repeat protein